VNAGAPARVVLFDLDDTLFAHRASVSAGLVAHVRALGRPYRLDDPDGEAAAWHAIEERHYHAYLAGELDYDGQRRARARDYAARHGVALDDIGATVWFDSFFEHYLDSWALHDDALPCLDALDDALPGVRFGMITNGDEAHQRRKVERLGLDARFEHVVASSTVGVAKPDPRIFRAACALFDVAPSQAVYVGDRLGTDAVGAARAGLTGVWLDRAEPTAEHADAAAVAEASAEGVIRITTLAELPGALTR
jgi:haloacid dehalogenase superfamily, subfamily IA, variant 3 with third motif having DD or ED/haloacid dehalogenase superfamily, subfamily IA, variant 1 with third motif having Dx(3-4)D or Dx(3-4)E